MKKSQNFRVVMTRHGESEWDAEDKFSGWYEIALSKKGQTEASKAGHVLKDGNYKFDVVFCSVLTRAKQTLGMILKELDQTNIPIQNCWRLNERHYGGLTGLNKTEADEKYGEDQVKTWRRSFNVPPPPIEKDHPFYQTILKDPKYENEPPISEFPMTESLELTIQRTLPYWNQTIVPVITSGKRVLIVAHEDSLRGVVKHLQSISDEDIVSVNLTTGIPFYYDLDSDSKPTGPLQFLGDEETVKRAMEDMGNQGKAKKK